MKAKSRFAQNRIPLLVAALMALAIGASMAQDAAAPAPIPTLTINADKVTAQVSPLLFGFMTEEINWCYDGGLYAEMISNRNFKYSPDNPVNWGLSVENGSAGNISLDSTQPLNDALNTSLKFDITTAGPTQRVSVSNDGFWGMAVKPNTTYHVSFYAKAAPDFKGPLTVALASNDKPIIYALGEVSALTADWKKYELTLTTGKDIAPSQNNRFIIWATSPGTLWLNCVSVFPPTYNNRPNGMRADIMQLLADYKPAFLRFPGGNYLEGNTLATRWDWKKTIGDISQRAGHYNDAWNYPSSDGVGLLEFLEWCEDLNIEPVMGIYAGYSMRSGPVGVGEVLDPYVQDGLDQIEYAIGDTSTKWGAQRAKDGHPAPFKLHYVEIGNEDNLGRAGGTYDGRYTQFYNAIKAKYPNIQIIASDGLKQADPANRTRVKQVKPDVVDDHYYPAPAAMKREASHYDADKYTHDNVPKVFVGEYATRQGNNGPITSSLEYALCDAAFLSGLERNADLVVMASYAPLFVNVNLATDPRGTRLWRTDLIGYDALNSYGSASYYAQKMFTHNIGDTTVAAKLDGLVSNPNTNFFYSVTRDSKTGTIYLKVINITDAPRPLKIDITGVSSVAPDGQATVLTSANLADINSTTEPTKVAPVTSKVDGLGTNFTYTFPPNSFTVLNIGAK